MIWRRHYNKVHMHDAGDINGEVKSDDDEERQKGIKYVLISLMVSVTISFIELVRHVNGTQ